MGPPGSDKPHEHARWLLGSLSAICGSVVAAAVLVAQTAVTREQILLLWASTLLIALGWFIAFFGLSKVRTPHLSFHDLTDEEKGQYDRIGVTKDDYDAACLAAARRPEVAAIQARLVELAAGGRATAILHRGIRIASLGILLAAGGAVIAVTSVLRQIDSSPRSCGLEPGVVLDAAHAAEATSPCWQGDVHQADLWLRPGADEATLGPLATDLGSGCLEEGRLLASLLVRADGTSMASTLPTAACAHRVQFEVDQSHWIVYLR